MPDSTPADLVILTDQQPSEGEKKMEKEDYGMLKMHCLNGAQRQADGAAAYAENSRYDYLEGKANVSMTEATGLRYIQGPHPQFGSPDGK